MPLFGAIPANQNVEVDPVYVGPSAPAGTPDSGDLWWDTDEPVTTPGSLLVYGQITANKTITQTAAATADLIIDTGSRTYEASPIAIEFHAPCVATPGGAGTNVALIQLFDGATDLGWIVRVLSPSGQIAIPVVGQRVITPTAGTHSYRVGGWVSPSGSGLVFAGPGTSADMSPAYLRITRA